MSACAHRPEDGCVFVDCAKAFPDRKCVCALEVKQDEVEEADLDETRVPVPDSARKEAS